MKLSEQELTANYEKIIATIEKYITGDRKDKLLGLYDQLSTRIITAPASSVNTFHGAHIGGYLVHVNKVIECALDMFELWKKHGALIDFKVEELIFVALNHDLGKIGDFELDYYIPNTSDWHIKNQGRVYVDNPEIINMSIPDRSLWLLQAKDIQVTQSEYLAIKLHDGPYVEENKPYYNVYQEHRKIRSNMILILHYADYMAARLEYEEEKVNRNPENSNVSKSNFAKKKLSDATASSSAESLFDAMFNKK